MHACANLKRPDFTRLFHVFGVKRHTYYPCFSRSNVYADGVPEGSILLFLGTILQLFFYLTVWLLMTFSIVQCF